MLPLLLLAACTHDDAPASPAGIPLPPDTYPLQIASVTISADGQPRTRLTDEGNSSKWQDNDKIMISLGDQQSVYTYTDTDGAWHSDNPLCWESTAPQEVNAWHPVNETIDFTQQSTKGLTYLLKADPVTATYDQSISLTFTHQLAKVRVELSGTQAGQVQTVKVFGYTSCTHDQGTISIEGATQDWIPMHKVDATTYEANVVPGTINLNNFIQINDQTATINDGFPTMLEAATMYTIDLTVGEPVTDITEENATISGDGHYRVSGNFGHTITVTGGKPNIYLEDANINVNSGNAISIEGGSATIHVLGDNNVSSNNGAGIYVVENSSVTITGRSQEDVLTARGGNGGNGIGGYTTISGSTATSTNSGNISVSNVTVYAYGSDYDYDTYAPGIGGAGTASCGTITIDNATVYAYGTGESYYNITGAAIGGGIDGNTKGSYSTITIRNNSEVYVQRGNHLSDYIGHSGSLNNPATATDGIDATVDENSTVTKLN